MDRLRRLWRRLVPPPEVREVRRLARSLQVLQRVQRDLLDEGGPAHLAALRARALDPDNPLTAVYNLWTAHAYARTLQPMSLDPTERLAEALFEALALHVVVTGIDPETGRYPRPERIAAILAMPDPAAILALLAESPERDVRGIVRLRRKRDADMIGAVTTLRWRYTAAVSG